MRAGRLSSSLRASCRIRTNDPEITNHVLWPTELKRRGWVSFLYRAATTNYLCCDQALEDSKGAGRIGLTRFRFAVAKVGIILKSAIACGDFFICFFRFSILSLFTAPYTDTLEGRYGFFPALRWTNIPFTKKYSSDMCNLIVRQLLNYRPTAVGR